MDLVAPEGISSPLRSRNSRIEKWTLKSWLTWLCHYLTLVYVTVLSDLGEVFLCLGTIGFPLMYLCLAYTINCYLIIKPVLHSLLPGVSYSQAFSKARKDVSAFFITYGQLMHEFEMEGFDNIPKRGGALIIYYHGAIPIDYLLLNMHILAKKNRIVSSVIDKFLYFLPGLEILCKGFSFHTGKPKFCIDWLMKGNLLGLAPGGAREAQLSTPNYEIMWGNRIGFARVAQEAGVPIIPVFTENIREVVVNLQFGLEWMSNLYEASRIPLVPMYGGFPVKLRSHIGTPIYPKPGQTAHELQKEVYDSIRHMIDTHQQLPGNVVRTLNERFQPSCNDKRGLVFPHG